jgi:hypothetical protein
MLVQSKNGSFSVPSDYDGAIIRMIKRSKNASYMLLQSRTIAGRKLWKILMNNGSGGTRGECKKLLQFRRS